MTKKKFKWCWDWLMMGFVLQNLILLVVILDKHIELNSLVMLLLIPYIFWGIELAKENLK